LLIGVFSQVPVNDVVYWVTPMLALRA